MIYYDDEFADKPDRRHLQRITNQTIKPILGLLYVQQQNFIPLNVVALVMGRSLRTIEYHTARGYLQIYASTRAMKRRYVTTLPDFIKYIKTYWRIDQNHHYVLKRKGRRKWN